jgi:hypothetical protein
MQQQSFTFVTQEPTLPQERQQTTAISMSQGQPEPPHPVDVGSLPESPPHTQKRRAPGRQGSGRQKVLLPEPVRPTMTFAEIFTALETKGVLPAGRVKDMKTSLRYLAQALGHTSPEECQVGKDGLDPTTWTDALETHFCALEARGRQVSAATRRNTRNNLRVLFRLANEHDVLAAPMSPRLFTKSTRRDFIRQHWASTPYPSTYRPTIGPRRYGLHQSQWPDDITQGFKEYQRRCGLRLRESTFRIYANQMVSYVGYFANICGRTPTWDDLFDVANLTEFVRWQAKRVERSVTTQGHHVTRLLATMANVLGRPERQALFDFRQALPTEVPLHNKRLHWIDLRELEAVAEDLLAEGRGPFIVESRTRNSGAHRSSQFQRGLILKLLVRIPLRQRNIREMQLGKHLSKDQHTGHWHLEFRGDELKIGARGGQVNTFHVDLTSYCPAFLPWLEEFLTVHRRRLPNSADSPFLFLSTHGKPFSAVGLGQTLSHTVAMRTGKRFYPHLIRTIWASEFLKETGDFTTAATMLGDTIGTVMKTYYDVVHADQHAKAANFLASALHP